MPVQQFADLQVGDRVQIIYRYCPIFGYEGTVTRIIGDTVVRVRVVIGGIEEEHSFSERTSLKKLSKPPKRPVSPVFYSLKETT